jgi:hypothetical protein
VLFGSGGIAAGVFLFEVRFSGWRVGEAVVFAGLLLPSRIIYVTARHSTGKAGRDPLN